MRLEIITTLLLVAGTATAAHAPAARPTAIRLGTPAHGRIDRVTLQVRDAPEHYRATLTIVLSSPASDVLKAPELVLPIDVSRDVTVAGLGLALGTGRAAIATDEAARDARDTYHRLVEQRRDPALLEWVGGTGRADRLRLHAFPVLEDAPATVTIELLLPHDAAQVVLDPGPQPIPDVEVDTRDAWVAWGRLAAARAIALADVIEAVVYEPYELARVDRRTSLVAREPVGAPVFVDPDRDAIVHRHVAAQPDTNRPLGARDLEEAVAAHATPLAHCYAYGRELDPWLSGSVQLVVAVGGDGAVTGMRIDGLDDATVSACVTDEIAGWKLRATGHADTVRTGVELARLR